MTRKITQEERLDLTDIRKEAEAYNRKLSDYCEAFGIDSKKVKEEYYHDIAVNSNEYKKLEKENQRLKTQLDKEIKINRKMKNAINLALSYLASPDRIKEDVPNEELAFQELRKALNEINKEE